MPELPTGTVTFRFTDIEGSTGLLQEQGEAYEGVLGKNRLVFKDAIEKHGGCIVYTSQSPRDA